MCSYSWRVPLHAFGKLTFITSCDIGDLGPKEGAAITYFWNPVYNIMGLLPWLLLVLAILLLPENRCVQVLWILLPAVIFRLLWAAFARLMDIPSEASALFILMIDCLLVGFILNWLLSQRIGNRNRFVTWLLGILIFGIAFVATIINAGLGIEAVQVSIFIGLNVGILMFSFPLAGLLCRKKFGPVRFSLWMAIWVMLTTLIFFMTVGVIQSLMIDYSVIKILLQVLMVSLIYGGILIVGLLPFEILLFANSFWRKRFEAVFGLKKVQKDNFDPQSITPEDTETTPA
jgi:hypothetical protein